MPPIVLVISAGDSGRGSSGPTGCVARYSTIRGGLDSQGGNLCICSCSVLRLAECVRHGLVRSRRPQPVLNDLLAFCPRPGFLRMHLGGVTDQLGLYIRRKHSFPAAGSGAHPRSRSRLHAGQATRCRITVEVLAPRFAQLTGEFPTVAGSYRQRTVRPRGQRRGGDSATSIRSRHSGFAAWAR